VEPGFAVIPSGGWPELEELQEKLEPAADDAAYLELMADVAQAAAETTAAIDTLTMDLTLENLYAYAEAVEQFGTVTGALEALEPGALGLFLAKEDWEAATTAVRESQAKYSQLLEGMLLDPDNWIPPEDQCPDCFTLVEVATTMAIGAIMAYVPTYNKILIAAGKAAASMAIMMSIADAIDAKFPAGPDAPDIQYITPGYGNAINDGASLAIYGNGFDYYPGHNSVIFIGPAVGDIVPDVVDTALKAMKAVKALQNLDNVFELTNAFRNIFATMKKGMKVAAKDIPALLETGIVPMQATTVTPFLDGQFDFWQQTVTLGPLPEVNDSWLPKVGLLIPISFTRGHGPTYKIVILP